MLRRPSSFCLCVGYRGRLRMRRACRATLIPTVFSPRAHPKDLLVAVCLFQHNIRNIFRQRRSWTANDKKWIFRVLSRRCTSPESRALRFSSSFSLFLALCRDRFRQESLFQCFLGALPLPFFSLQATQREKQRKAWMPTSKLPLK